ncbi:MAG TPA: 6-phosphogluconolactonase [Phycisphaerae bacterium]|nr:6-phosphogluconolactonase [Phycisphaerae bacterium]
MDAQDTGREMMSVIVKYSVEQATEFAAKEFARIVQRAADSRGACAVAMAGGTTPYVLYRKLAQTVATGKVPWEKVEVFFGDERDVPLDNVESNYCMARRTLLDNVPIEPTKVHPMRGDAEDLQAAAAEYEDVVRDLVPADPGGVPRFDLVLLGMGADGHTASLFPGTEALDVSDRLVIAYHVPVLGRKRMTFTFPLINAARDIVLLVTGEDKADAVARLLGHDEAAKRPIPAARIHTDDGRITLILDAAAAKQTGREPG